MREFRQSIDGLISLLPPAVPMWGVFFDPEESDGLEILPVVTLALIEEKRGDPGTRIIRALCFSRLYGLEEFWHDESEALGFLLAEELPRAAEIFAADLVYEREKAAANRKKLPS